MRSVLSQCGRSAAKILLGLIMAGTTMAQAQEKEPVEKKQVFRSVETMPEFRGQLGDYLGNNLHYPEAVEKAGVEGRVVAQFVIDQDGNVGDIVILRGLHPDCDKEVLRVLGNMPAWRPGQHEGKPVSVYYTLPVSFRLQDAAPQREHSGPPTAPNK